MRNTKPKSNVSPNKIRQGVEVTDVSTPATVIRYTCQLAGQHGRLAAHARQRFRSLAKNSCRLAALHDGRAMVTPGGGLPSGLMIARSPIHALCREDQVRFYPDSTASGTEKLRD